MVEYLFISEPGPEQTDQVTHLYREAGWWTPEEPDNPELVSRLVAGSHCFLVAVSGERIVGMGRAISDRASDAYIQDVTVLGEWRGRGIAAEIVRSLMTRLRGDGLHWIGLVAERGTAPLYRGLGFEEMPNATALLAKD